MAPSALWVWTFGKGFSSQDGHPFPRLLCGPKRLGNLAQALRLGLRPEGPRELSPGFSLGLGRLGEPTQAPSALNTNETLG